MSNVLRSVPKSRNHAKPLFQIANIHRSRCTSVDVSNDGRFLATAGDKVVKIWDYHMRQDLNFQVLLSLLSETEGKSCF